MSTWQLGRAQTKTLGHLDAHEYNEGVQELALKLEGLKRAASSVVVDSLAEPYP